MRRSMIITGLVTCTLLLVPLIAMHFTDEVSWGVEDFVAAAVLLFATGTGIAAALRLARTTATRVAVVTCIAVAAAVVWVELAVGLLT